MPFLANIPPELVQTMASNAMKNAGSTEQVVSVTDLISEGPIGGLVTGGGSIYLNDDPIFDDSEVGYQSTQGLSISHTTSGSTTIEINNYTEDEFDYEPEPFSSGVRYLLIHDLQIYNTGITFNEADSATTDTNAQTGFTLALNGNFANLTDTMVSSETDLQLNNFTNGDAIAFVYSPSEDRFIEGMIMALNWTGADGSSKTKENALRISLSTKDIENADWLRTSTDSFIVKISQLIQVSSISGNTINIAQPNDTLDTFTNKSFAISEPIYTNTFTGTRSEQQRKIPSSGFQFRPGTVDQKPIQNLTGDAGVNSLALPVANVRELKTGNPQSIIYTGSAAAEIDKVRLVFKYPSGLYNLNKESGDKGSAGAGYAIRLLTQNADETTFTDRGFLEGNTQVSQELRNQFTTSLQGGTLQVGTPSPLLSNTTIADGINVQFHPGVTGDCLEVGTMVFSHAGKYLSGVSFTHIIDLSPFQPYTGFKLVIVRVTHSESSTDDGAGRAHNANLSFRHDNNDFQGIHGGGIQSAIGVITDKVHYPYSALANVTFNTRQFTSMPTRNYEVYGLKVKVPHNYKTREEVKNIKSSDNPVTPEYVGGPPNAHRLYGHVSKDSSGNNLPVLFNGSLRTDKVYTDNPAWVFYDILTNNRYGVGEFVNDIDIDVFSLYKIARYCDELVPDGKGGFEPRFRANIYLTKAKDCYKIIKDFATIFRGMLYWMNGQLTPIMDEKKAPIFNFNRSNVIEGRFEYETAGSKTRINQMVVQWNNPKNEYKIEPLFVEDRENIISTGRIVKGKAVAFGCTSRGQAQRYGRWKLWTAINQTEVVSFSTAINAIFLAPGDVINVQDNHDSGFAYGGRLLNAVRDSSSTKTTLTLDRDMAHTLSGDGFSSDPGSNYLLALLLSESSVILNEDATIGSTEHKAGDAITQWYDNAGNLVTVNSPSTWTDADYNKYVNDAYADTSGTLLNLTRAEHTRIKEVECETTVAANSNNIIVTKANELTEDEKNSALAGRIWALKDDPNNPTEASLKQYKILSIIQDEDNQYTIAAGRYYPEKFDSIETSFSPVVDDPLFPTEVGKVKVKAPKGLRVLRLPNLERPGEEILLNWDPPDNQVDLAHYEIQASIPGFPEIIQTSNTSYEFTAVPNGYYTFQVRAVDNRGRSSAPAIAEAEIEDFFGGNFDREFEILKGGVVDSRAFTTNTVVDGVISKFLKFEKNPTSFYSPTDTSPVAQTLSGIALNYEILSKYQSDSTNHPWVTNSEAADLGLIQSDAFVFYDDYKAGGSLKLINRIYDKTLNLDYWYDQTVATEQAHNDNFDSILDSNKALISGSPSIWEQVAGTVTIDNESSKVVGIGTNFTTQYGLTDIIKFSPDQAARIAYIQNNQTLYIDRIFTYKTHTITSVNRVNNNTQVTYNFAKEHDFEVGNFVSIVGVPGASFDVNNKKKIVSIVNTPPSGNVSGSFSITINHATTSSLGAPSLTAKATTEITGSEHYRNNLRPNFRQDFLLGKLSSGGNFKTFLTLDPNISPTRTINVDSNVAFIRYDGQTPVQQVRSSTNNLKPVYNNITLTITAFGFTDPRFKVTGAGFSEVTTSADSDFSGGTEGVYSKLIEQDNLIDFDNGSQLDFTIQVKEAVEDTVVSRQFSIIKIQDGSIGVSGRTVHLEASDYSIIYDKDGVPQFNAVGGKIPLTATAHNFTSAKFKFTTTSATDVIEGTEDTSFSAGTTDSDGVATGTKNVIVPTTKPSDSIVLKVEVVEATNENVVLAEDSITLAVVEDGVGGPSVILSNASHSYPTDKFGNSPGSGANPSNAPVTIPLSGTSIEVIGGGEPLIYKGVTSGWNTSNKISGNNLPLEPQQWYINNISSSGNDVTIGSISSVTPAQNPTIVEIGNHSMHNSSHGSPTDDSEVITYEIIANIGGNEVTLTQKQTLSKSKQGAEGAAHPVLYAVGTSNSASDFSDVPTAVYNFDTGAITNIANTTLTWTQDQPSVSSATPYLWGIRTQNAIFPPTTADSGSNPGNTVSIAESDWDTPFRAGAFGDSGVDAKAIKLLPNRHVIIYKEDDPSAEDGNQTITFTTEIQGVTNLSPVVKFDIDGVEHTVRNSSDFVNGSANFTLPQTEEPVPTGHTNYSSPSRDETTEVRARLFATIDGTSSLVASDTVTIFAVRNGTDGITPFLTNPTHIEPADTDGTLIDDLLSDNRIAGAGGSYQFFEGGTDLGGTNVSYAVESEDSSTSTHSIKTVSNLRIKVNKSNGDYTLHSDSTGWSTDSQSFVIVATHTPTSGVSATYPLTYSITKSKKGEKGQDAIFIQPTPVSFSIDGTTFDPDNTSTISVFTGGTSITNAQWDVTSGGTNVLSVTGNATSGTLTFKDDRTSAQAKGGAEVRLRFETADTTGVQERRARVPTTVNGEVGTDGKISVAGQYYFVTNNSTNPLPSGDSTVTYDLPGSIDANTIGVNPSASINSQGQEAPTYNPTDGKFYWISFYSGTQTTDAHVTNNEVPVTMTQAKTYTNFDGVVSFTDLSDTTSGTTIINGGRINTNTIAADKLTIGNVPTGVNPSTGSYTRIHDDKIEIYNSGALRVKLGNLN